MAHVLSALSTAFGQLILIPVHRFSRCIASLELLLFRLSRSAVQGCRKRRGFPVGIPNIRPSKALQPVPGFSEKLDLACRRRRSPDLRKQ